MPRPIGLLPQAAAPPRPPMFRSLGIAASGLSAQRVRMETIASNIANAETTRDVNGGPYRRRVAVLAPGEVPSTPDGIPAPVVGGVDASGGPFGGTPPFLVPSAAPPGDAARGFEVPVLQAVGGTSEGSGVRVAAVTEDQSVGELVYDPGHPDADKNGYVRYPNVRITDEMVDMMDARRVYEANATVFQAAKAMLRRALDI